MNVSELCATPSKATNHSKQTMESYSLGNTYREPDQDISNNNTSLTQSLYTLPPLSQRRDLHQRLPSVHDISTSFEESTEDSAEEVQTTESIKGSEGLEIKQLIEKCSTLCNDLARYKTWRKGLEIDREAIFDFVTHTAHDILDSLVAMQQQQDAMVSNEAEYEMIRQARNWKENRKPKYRRRSKRNMIGQQCHSCHTSETPEWRRGPDGARTLCNACGLHYSKLMRKESVTVASYKLLGNGPNNTSSSSSSNNEGIKKIEHQLRPPHHPHEDHQLQELQHRPNDNQHNHPNHHHIQPSPPIPRQHQQQQQQQQQQQHHIHHPHSHRHHHPQTHQPSLSHHHPHHQSPQHRQISQTHPSHQHHH